MWMCILITLGERDFGFSLVHSRKIFRISNVSYAHSKKHNTGGHTVILDSWNTRQLFMTNDFLKNPKEKKNKVTG